MEQPHTDSQAEPSRASARFGWALRILVVAIVLLGSSISTFGVASAKEPLVAELTIYADGSAIGEGLPGWTGGHAFISVKNISTSNINVGNLGNKIPPQQMVTMGTFGNRDEHLGLWYNLESYSIQLKPGGYATTSFTLGITATELKTLNAYIDTHDTYGKTLVEELINNCSSFAAGAWNSVAPIKFKVFAGLPLQSPAALAISIGTFPGAQYGASVNIPWNPLGVWYAQGKKAPIRSITYATKAPTLAVTPKTGPTGTVATFTGICTPGSTGVVINETLAVNKKFGTANVKTDGSWSTTVTLSDDKGHPSVKDRATGLLVWPAIKWRFHTTCSGGSLFTYPDTNISTTRGVGLKTQTVTTSTGYNVTVSAAACPYAASYVSIIISIPGKPYYGNPSVKSDRSWDPVTIVVPKPSASTTFQVNATCYDSSENDSFVYTPQPLVLG